MYIDKEIISNPRRDSIAASGLLLVAFVLRLYAFMGTAIINRDGVWYINQARAIWENDWDLARKCGFDFISLYHLLIPLSYRVFGDWVLGAQAISFFFGTIAVIPLFFILRQNFRTRTAFGASLAFAMNPFFVSYSVELVKDPIFWFFALLGLMFFVIALRRDGRLYLLSLSSISFLIAGFARFEVLIYVVGSLLYLLFFEEERLKKTLIFAGPILFLIAIVNVLDAYLTKETLHLWSFYLMPRIHRFFTDISESLFAPDIFEKSVLSIKLMLFKMAKVLYIPFIPFFVAGFARIGKDLRGGGYFRYFVLLSGLSLIALYFFYIKIHVLSPRYTVFFILPTLVFMCSGIEKIVVLLTAAGLKEKIVIPLVGLYLISAVLAVPSNLIPTSPDKIIYRTIGEYIAELEGNKSATVMAPDSRIMFYANLHSAGLKCGNRLIKYKQFMGMKNAEMVPYLKSNGVKYFLFEAVTDQNVTLRSPVEDDPKHFREMKSWEEGRLILYRVL